MDNEKSGRARLALGSHVDSLHDADFWALVDAVVEAERGMTIAEWQKEIGEWAKRKGWDMSKLMSSDPEVKRDFVMHKLALVHTEVSEAVECVRDDEYITTGGEVVGGDPIEPVRITKPEGMASELADTVIRILHICEAMGIDLDKEIEIKMAYNEQRPFMHGRKA